MIDVLRPDGVGVAAGSVASAAVDDSAHPHTDAFGQPTLAAFTRAWSYAIAAGGTTGVRSDALVALRQLRESKPTWFGIEENRLRAALDAYLRSDA